MGPLKVYKLLDGTTRQYREGEQPEGAVEVRIAAKETPESRKAPVKRRAKKEE